MVCHRLESSLILAEFFKSHFTGPYCELGYFCVFRVACRFDCASKYELEIELWSKNHKILDQHKIKKQWRQWDSNMWQKVYTAFVFHIFIRVGFRWGL